MNNIDHTNHWEHKGIKYKFEIFLTDNLQDLDGPTQVYVLVINESSTKVLLVKTNRGAWILPGGGVEGEETVLQTAVREVKEETNREVDVQSMKPFFYQLAYEQEEDGKWRSRGKQSRVIMTVSEDIVFIEDPDEDIVEVKWVLIEEINKYIDWDQTGTMIEQELLGRLK